jgi:hypothetical protein
MSEIVIKGYFPNLTEQNFAVTSPQTTEYNCIAWAAGDMTAWWWPDLHYQYFWPEEVPRNESLSAFKYLFESLGYQECNNYDYEEGFDKIAIYRDMNYKTTHASKLLSPGVWSSKLGKCEDIEHSFHGLDSDVYGSVALVMKRPNKA